MVVHDTVTESYNSVTVLRIDPTQAGTLPGFSPGERDARSKDDYA